MNGSEKQIYEAIVNNGKRLAVLEERQENQHKENRKDIQYIRESIKNIPRISGQVHIQWWFIGAIVLGLLGTIFVR